MAVSLARREIYVMTTKLSPFWLNIFSKYTTHWFVAMGDGDNGSGMVRRYCAEQLAKRNEEELKRNLESGDKENSGSVQIMSVFESLETKKSAGSGYSSWPLELSSN